MIVIDYWWIITGTGRVHESWSSLKQYETIPWLICWYKVLISSTKAPNIWTNIGVLQKREEKKKSHSSRGGKWAGLGQIGYVISGLDL